MKKAIVAVFVLALFFGCAKNDKGLIDRIFDLESRSKQGASPSKIDELEQAIQESGAVVEKLVAESDKLSSFWRLLTVRYTEKGMYGEAVEAAKKALNFNPNDPGLYYMLGVSAGNMAKTGITDTQNPEAAKLRWRKLSESSYLQALKLDDKNYRSMYGLAVLYVFEFENPDAALPYIEKYLAIQQKDVNGWFLYGRTLYMLGRLQEASDAYANAAKFTSNKDQKNQAEANQKQIMDELYGTK